MSLITRQEKGNKLTFEELENNFSYLEEKILTPIEYSYKITNSVNIDWSEANFQEIELSGDTEFNFTGATAGQKLTLLLNTKFNNLTWPNLVKWSDSIKYNLRVNNLVNTFSLPLISSIAIQDDGKILVGGSFTSYSGVSSNRLIRLNSNGSQDTSFVIGTGFNNAVRSIAIQDDGKILVGGSFTSYNGVSANRIIRLNSDGSRDTSFVIGTGFNNSVYSIAIQADGKILVGGWFSTYNGVSANRIIRLNTDGSRDTSFVIGTGFNGNQVFSITIQADGKILVGGWFSTYNGVSANYIIRLNSDGSRDTSFVIGFNNTVRSISIQADGKILIGGTFTSYNGVSANCLIRVNSDGSVDESFDIGTGFDNGVLSIAIQADGKILIGGWFSEYNGVSANYIIRLNSDGSVDESFYSITNRISISVNDIKITNGFTFIGGSGLIITKPLLTYNKINFYYDGEFYIGGK